MANNHFVLDRKILETIWSSRLFREANGYHGYQPEKSIDSLSGVCLRCQLCNLFVWLKSRSVRGLVNLVTLVRVAAQPLEPLTLWRLQQRSKQSLSFYFLYLYYPWPKDFRSLFYTLTITTRGLKKQTSAASYAIPATLKRASVMEEWLAKQRWSKKFDQRRRMYC